MMLIEAGMKIFATCCNGN